MLHRISISVTSPLRVANVLAEIMQGQAVPFLAHSGSYLVGSGDKFGTAIELYPIGTELIPDLNDGQVGFQVDLETSYYIPFHATISVPTDLAEIERIGARERWRALVCDRGGFDVVEFWLENRLMVEFLTPAMVTKYLNRLQEVPREVLLNATIAVGSFSHKR